MSYPVRFGGRVEPVPGGDGARRWRPADDVLAMAYDIVIPGHGTRPRQHAAAVEGGGAGERSTSRAFNVGDYMRARSASKNRSENISWVLYPDDSTPAGRELRLRQEYFFVAPRCRTCCARYLRRARARWRRSPSKVAIQLNDTHPAIAVAELMRLLVDEHGMAWDAAWASLREACSRTPTTR